MWQPCLFRRQDRDEKEQILVCQLQGAGIVFLTSGLMVGLSLVQISWL